MLRHALFNSLDQQRKWAMFRCAVVVAMSGGVDSSVTAQLLADQVRQTVVLGWERIVIYSGPFLTGL